VLIESQYQIVLPENGFTIAVYTLNTTHSQRLFSSAYIIGGSPCSGKSTIAEALASQYGLQYYKADDHDPEHMRRSNPDQQPIMFKLSRMSWDAIWSQAPEKQCTDERTYYRENFPFILEDLAKLDEEKPVLLEGAAFLPELITSLPVKPENVVYMIPTLEFQLYHYSQRTFVKHILKDCQDPKQAFENWMQRDHLFGLELMRKAKECGFRVILVDGSVDIQGQFETVRAQFNLKSN
jgi:2-phosphoglycerate kinase